MDGVEDEDRDLEFDPLANGKPVELVPQHRSDVVELPRGTVRGGSMDLFRLEQTKFSNRKLRAKPESRAPKNRGRSKSRRREASEV